MPMFIKNRKKLNKRGFTLVELTIVIAIAAIISVMIVSFSTLISAQVKKNNLRADFMQSVVDFRTDLQIEFAKIDKLDESGNSLSFSVSVNNTEKSIQFDNDSSPFSWVEFEYIDSIAVEPNGEMLKITLTNNTLKETQSFILISKTGGEFTLI